MNIILDTFQQKDHAGRIACLQVSVAIEHSPREGFDNDAVAALERDLGEYITSRLNAALEKGRAGK